MNLCYTDQYKDRKTLFLALDKRNEQLKRQDQLIIELKQKLKNKDQESGIVLHNINWLISSFIDNFNGQKHVPSQIKV